MTHAAPQLAGRRLQYLLLAAVLAIAGVVMAGSARDDTPTTDETLYLPTGYQYLTERSSRYGFEHPPLFRDIAALPLLFVRDLKPYTTFLPDATLPVDLNSAVWVAGPRFLSEQTIRSHDLMFLGRVPMILLTLLLAWLVFRFAEKRRGLRAAWFTAALVLGSPLVLGHGRLATTDVPTALTVFLALTALERMLREQTTRSSLLFGVCIAIAFLTKFALLVLGPFCLAFCFVRDGNPRTLARLLLGFATAAAAIWVVYRFHLEAYPIVQHLDDIRDVLARSRPDSHGAPPWMLTLAGSEATRPWAHYLFGAWWQFSRPGAFGYYFGEGSFAAWKSYYAFGFFAKHSLAFHVLLGIAAFTWIRTLREMGSVRAWAERAGKSLSEDPFVFLAAAWVGYYFFTISFVNKGNTGSRYLLPLLPFVYLGVAFALDAWVQSGASGRARRANRAGIVVFLLVWQGASVLGQYPSFLSYFNEAFRGRAGGGWYLVDTDLEWGQDAKRLADWVKARGIDHISVAAELDAVTPDGLHHLPASAWSPAYSEYLGSRLSVLVPGEKPKGWLAIPARAYFWGQARSAQYRGWQSDTYRWLAAEEPVARIGNSIVVYHLD